MIETKKLRFALSGSSARKLKCGAANLLAGRDLTLHLEGFTASELKGDFDLNHCLDFGTLSKAQTNAEAAIDFLQSYLHTYLREETREEGLVRRLEPFLRFLEVAGAMNGLLTGKALQLRQALRGVLASPIPRFLAA